MNFLDQIPVPNPSVVSRIVNDEAVLVIPSLGKVKVLNAVGARIWTLIDGKKSIGEILTAIQTEYAVDEGIASHDLDYFLTQLVDRKIITITRSPSYP